MYERAQHHLYSLYPPVNAQQMPSPPVSFWPAQPRPGIPGLWPGSSQHVAAKEPRAGRAACVPPSILLCRAVGALVLEPAQGLWEDQRNLSKPRLLPSFSCHWVWQDVPVTPEPQELAGSELTVNSWLSRWGRASPGSQPPLLQLPVPPGQRRAIPAEPSSPSPPSLCTGYSPWLTDPSDPCPSSLFEGPLKTLIPGPKNY